MKQYRYRGKKKHSTELLYLVGIVLFVVLAISCWFELLNALEASMIELPATVEVRV